MFDRRTIIFILALAVTFFGVNAYFGPREDKSKARTEEVQQTKQIVAPTNTHLEQEQLFVLENDYIQLVFSNRGGAVKEINLPFKTAQNQKSVVLPIGFDREMAKDYPYNDQFPHGNYTTFDGTAKQGQTGGYYPLIRRDLVTDNRGNETIIPARLYALNIVSDYPEMAEMIYTVKEFTNSQIVFESTQQNRRISKTFSLQQGGDVAPYILDLIINVEGESRGLWLTSGVPEVELLSGSSTPTLKYRITRKGKGEVEKIDLPKDKEAISVTSTFPDWIVNSNGYLGVIMDPKDVATPGYKVQYVPGSIAPTRLLDIDKEYDRFKAKDYPGYIMQLPLRATGGEMHYRIFAGPFEDTILKQVDNRFTDSNNGNPDYTACQTFFGWFSFISEPFAKFLYLLMSMFYKLTHSWAFSIVLLTVALRIMLYPLNSWSMKSMRRMQELSPEVTAIQARYKKDPKKAQMEVMNLYRTKKVNPFTGCLPLLIQMPFLVGMFDLLKSTFELRGAVFIPGWIDNLTAPDVLFSWNYPVPFFGTEFHLLPFLLGGVMFLQQKMSSTLPKDKSLLTDQQRQQQFMGNIMVLVFSVMFYHFPSGLNIYWLCSMLLGIAQQWFTNRTMKKTQNTPQVTIVK
ncbi:MAG: membrane protein insertase YidC [Parachlamydiales bacterium]|nr:membrane protein insertase YidC [Parachlamydiales bacterium]